MLIWSVEMDAREMPLERVNIPAIRSVIDPIRDELAKMLAEFSDDGELSVIFVVRDDTSLAVTLKGDPFSVNRARDILGNTYRFDLRAS